MRHRRQIGRISLHQQALVGHTARRVAHFFGIAESNDAGKGNVKAALHRPEGRVVILDEAVHHTAHLVRALFVQDAQRVFGRLAHMDDERLADVARTAHLDPQTLLLQLRIDRIPKVVEPGLADRDDLRITRQTREFVARQRRPLVVVRVHPDRGIDARMMLRQVPHHGRILEAHGHAQEMLHALATSPVEIIPDAIEFRIHQVKVTVRIDKHDRFRKWHRGLRPRRAYMVWVLRSLFSEPAR